MRSDDSVARRSGDSQSRRRRAAPCHLSAMCLLVLALTGSANAQVFISEYVEGSLTNKAIEIYNGTGTTIDLFTDGYKVIFFYDGASTPSRTIQLTGTIAPGRVYVLAHQNSVSEILSHADQIDGGGFFDGDDAVQLINNSGVLDIIGQVGVDPGTEWGSGVVSTRDNTLCRKSSILVGDPDGTDVFDPSADWDGFDQDVFSNLGNHAVGPLPVELSSFTGISDDGTVWLRWTTESEQWNAGFEIQEISPTGHIIRIVGFVPGVGNSNRALEYVFRIRDVEAGPHGYRLVQFDLDGSFAYLGRLEVEVAPDRYGLLSTFPNPFNPTARIVFAVPNAGAVRLVVHDLTGREVASVVEGWLAGGVHQVDFDARGLASGVYSIQLDTAGGRDFRSIVLVD